MAYCNIFLEDLRWISQYLGRSNLSPRLFFRALSSSLVALNWRMILEVEIIFKKVVGNVIEILSPTFAWSGWWKSQTQLIIVIQWEWESIQLLQPNIPWHGRFLCCLGYLLKTGNRKCEQKMFLVSAFLAGHRGGWNLDPVIPSRSCQKGRHICRSSDFKGRSICKRT